MQSFFQFQLTKFIHIGGDCLLEDTCVPDNSDCYNAICTCHPGYSYNPANDSCVTCKCLIYQH